MERERGQTILLCPWHYASGSVRWRGSRAAPIADRQWRSANGDDEKLWLAVAAEFRKFIGGCGDLLMAAQEADIVVLVVTDGGVLDLGKEVNFEISTTKPFSVKANSGVTPWWCSVGEGSGELRPISNSEAYRRHDTGGLSRGERRVLSYAPVASRGLR